jgi:hypothetical protein
MDQRLTCTQMHFQLILFLILAAGMARSVLVPMQDKALVYEWYAVVVVYT